MNRYERAEYILKNVVAPITLVTIMAESHLNTFSSGKTLVDTVTHAGIDAETAEALLMNDAK
jgi:hypothetical protein